VDLAREVHLRADRDRFSRELFRKERSANERTEGSRRNAVPLEEARNDARVEDHLRAFVFADGHAGFGLLDFACSDHRADGLLEDPIEPRIGAKAELVFEETREDAHMIFQGFDRSSGQPEKGSRDEGAIDEEVHDEVLRDFERKSTLIGDDVDDVSSGAQALFFASASCRGDRPAAAPPRVRRV